MNYHKIASGVTALLVVTSVVASLGIGLSGTAEAGTSFYDFEGSKPAEFTGWDSASTSSSAQIVTNNPIKGSQSLTFSEYGKVDVSSANRISFFIRPESGERTRVRFNNGASGSDNDIANIRWYKGDVQITDSGLNSGSVGTVTPGNVYLVTFDIEGGNYRFTLSDESGNELVNTTRGTSAGGSIENLYWADFENKDPIIDNFAVDNKQNKQSLKQSTTTGYVTDNRNNTLSNATIVSKDSGGNYVSVTSNSSGYYSITAFDSGNGINLTTTKSGYEKKITTSVTNTSKNITLQSVQTSAEGKVLTGYQEPATKANIYVYDSYGNLVETTFVDGNGEYSLTNTKDNIRIVANGSQYYGNDTVKTSLDSNSSQTIQNLYLTVNATSRNGYAKDVTDPIVYSSYKKLNTQSVKEKCSIEKDDSESQDDGLLNGFSKRLSAVLNPQVQDGAYNPSDSDVQQVTICKEISDEVNQTRNNMVATTAIANQSGQTSRAIMNNYLTDSRGPSMSESKIIAYNALKNNSTEAQAEIEANESIDGFYHSQQVNAGNTFTEGVEQAKYAYETEKQETGQTGDWVVVKTESGSTIQLDHSNPFQRSEVNTGYANFTITTFKTENGNIVTPFPNSTTAPNGGPYVQGPRLKVTANPTETAPDQGNAVGAYTTIGESDEWYSIVSDIESQKQQQKDNAAQIINGTYTQYDKENITDVNTSEFLTPSEIASRAATDYNSTGYYSYAAMQLAAQGYSVNATTSHIIETADGRQLEGTLAYTGFDLDNLTVGNQYNPENYNGTFLIATNDGILTLDKEFKIIDQYDAKTGESVEETSIEPYTYETTNSDNLTEELEGLSDLQDAYDTTQTIAATGGSGGSGDSSSNGLPDWLFETYGGVPVWLFGIAVIGLLTIVGAANRSV